MEPEKRICSVVGCHKTATCIKYNGPCIAYLCLYHSLPPEVVEELYYASISYKHNVIDGKGSANDRLISEVRFVDAIEDAQGLEPEGAGR